MNYSHFKIPTNQGSTIEAEIKSKIPTLTVSIQQQKSNENHYVCKSMYVCDFIELGRILERASMNNTHTNNSEISKTREELYAEHKRLLNRFIKAPFYEIDSIKLKINDVEEKIKSLANS